MRSYFIEAEVSSCDFKLSEQISTVMKMESEQPPTEDQACEALKSKVEEWVLAHGGALQWTDRSVRILSVKPL